jgi:hypothetical protein
MRLLFASGDVGGARAIHPIVVAAAAAGLMVHVLRNGHIATLPEVPGVQWVEPRHQAYEPATTLKDLAPDALCFATSVRDDMALRFAAECQELAIPAIHVLDNWASYRRRLQLGGRVLYPDIYAVMDTIAATAVADAGFPSDTIRVTGTPALSRLQPIREARRVGSGLRLAFISEPVEMDQGSDPASLHYRGYVESTVLSIFAQAMNDCADVTRVDILAHPREDVARLDAIWRSVRGKLTGGVADAADRDNVLACADGIVGMSSILLYEMWLRGKPVASLQPGLRLPELRMLSEKKGLAFFDDASTAIAGLRHWKTQIATYRPTRDSVMERARHENAAEAILGVTAEIVRERRRAMR